VEQSSAISFLPAGAIWYQQAYFMSGLADELEAEGASRRPTAVIYLQASRCSRQAERRICEFVRIQTDRMDFAGMLEGGDYAICLVNAGRDRATIIANKLRFHLQDFDPLIGIAVSDEDGETAAEMMICARLDAYFELLTPSDAPQAPRMEVPAAAPAAAPRPLSGANHLARLPLAV
jgi:hypothetical protein